MNLNITGHHVTVTDAMRAHVVSKLGRVKRHFDNVIDANVVMSVEKLRQKVEITLHVSGKDVHAAAESENLYTAIDDMIDKLDRQVVKHKERIQVSRDQGFERKRVDVAAPMNEAG